MLQRRRLRLACLHAQHDPCRAVSSTNERSSARRRCPACSRRTASGPSIQRDRAVAPIGQDRAGVAEAPAARPAELREHDEPAHLFGQLASRCASAAGRCTLVGLALQRLFIGRFMTHHGNCTRAEPELGAGATRGRRCSCAVGRPQLEPPRPAVYLAFEREAAPSRAGREVEALGRGPLAQAPASYELAPRSMAALPRGFQMRRTWPRRLQ